MTRDLNGIEVGVHGYRGSCPVQLSIRAGAKPITTYRMRKALEHSLIDAPM